MLARLKQSAASATKINNVILLARMRGKIVTLGRKLMLCYEIEENSKVDTKDKCTPKSFATEVSATKYNLK